MPPSMIDDLREGLSADEFEKAQAAGRITVMRSRHGERRPLAVGAGLSTKVNANIGTSSHFPSLEAELEKLSIALDAGADAVMDLSTGGDLDAIRLAVLKDSPVAVGTVPLYGAWVKAIQAGRRLEEIEPEEFFAAVEEHAADGVDFATLHCGVTRSVLKELRSCHRVAGIVSRGGAALARWMEANDCENPLYEHFDRLLDISSQHGMAISLGDGLRPGAIADAGDAAQYAELAVLGELVGACRSAGVPVIVEGPGHVPLHEVREQMEAEKRICDEAPFYVLGPLVTDVGVGYDHITSAIGGALAAMSGADFLCYVTPREHLGLPDAEDVRQGVLAARIAAHAGDIAKGVPGAAERDRAMSVARKALDWEKQAELALDPATARCKLRERSPGVDECSMCGELCAMRVAP